MKNPFANKKNTADGASDAGAGKESVFKKIRNLFRYKVSLNVVRYDPDEANGVPDLSPPETQGQRSETAESPAQADSGAAETPAPAENKTKKAKKAAKPKVKKKKPAKKPAKQKKNNAKNGDEKKKTGLFIGIGIGGVAVVGGAIAAFMILGSSPTPAELLEKADKHLADQKYEQAETIYIELVDSTEEIEQEIIVSAYLNLSQTYLEQDVQDSAIVTLQRGYDRTGDARIKEKLDELLPPEESQEDPAKPAEPPNEPVVWTDPALEKMVRTALGVTPSQQIMTRDLESITSLKIVGPTHAVIDKPLNAYNKLNGYSIDGVDYTERGGITSLADIKHFKNLRKLVVCYNEVSDISGIEGLQSLDTLGLYFNRIKSIDDVASLPNLKNIYLYNNEITDLSPVSSLSGLTELWVQYNDIADLSPVKDLVSLRELFVSNNNITDISPIAQLTGLTFFYADNNGIDNIEAVAGLQALTDVSFVGNPIADMTPAAGIRNVNKTFSESATK
ncbi:MAG: leucine-rich repeat domain-containing protein [Oscillospiraceae bacterium]|nr:leucine-rich repeat domain-containing protein [Oscillospiraceae bacterium]